MSAKMKFLCMEDAHLSNDVALLGIPSILVLNVILEHLECSFRVFSVYVNLQVVRLVVGIIILRAFPQIQAMCKILMIIKASV